MSKIGRLLIRGDDAGVRIWRKVEDAEPELIYDGDAAGCFDMAEAISAVIGQPVRAKECDDTRSVDVNAEFAAPSLTKEGDQ